ncbi:MAG: DUF5808 domain-containing protein [Promicromonosporaceae bacterium]|nr:DUF5808 domain-containing protein [Promicromonosporaceae bacterium]
MAKCKNFITLAGIGLTVAAVAKELKKPEAERTWEGKVGPVPYDFTIPTVSKVKERVWNPDSEQIFTPHIFGAGWSINFGRLYRLGRQELDRMQEHCAAAE